MNPIKRISFLIGLVFVAISDALRGRALATNIVFTPQETSHGTESLLGDAAVTFANAIVTKTGATDDRHFKLCTLVSDIPYGILQRDMVDTGETNSVPKGIAVFGIYPESLPAVAAAAIAVNDRLVADLATPGRVKTLPVASGTYYVIGRSRFAVAAAGDPVSIQHHVAGPVVIP
jgi:hypothetical protein